MKFPIALLLSIIVIHFAANTFGLYEMQIEAGFVWIDNVLHILVGIAIGLCWLYFLNRKKSDASFAFKGLSTVVVVLIAAVVWELLELALYLSMQTYAVSLNIYSPSVLEAIEDVVSNAIGGLFVSASVSLKTHFQSTNDA